MVSTHPQLRLAAPNASPEEAAAIVAAFERFMRATAPPSTASTAQTQDAYGWQRAAFLEAVSRDPWVDAPDPG